MPQGRDPFHTGRYIYSFPNPEPVRTPVDPTRPKGYKLEPLEKYELKQLTMIGAISQSDGEFSALIDLGEGKIITIRKGDYIGKDHGIITKITEKKIVISEKFSIATKEMPDAGKCQGSCHPKENFMQRLFGVFVACRG